MPESPAAASSGDARAVLGRVPLEFLQKNLLLPLDGGGGDSVRIGISSRESLPALEDIRLMLERDVEPVLMSQAEVEEGLRQLLVARLGTSGTGLDDDAPLVLGEEESTDLMRVSTEAPVVQLVNSMFLKAVGSYASDIHLEPYEDQAIVRMRVDGVLQDAFTIPRARYSSVVARLKVMARLNLAEARLPQDGRIKVRASDRSIDIRVSTVPTVFGERVVLRLLDRGLRMLTLHEVGLDADNFDQVREFGTFPHGLILSTGPTGSGKSTTLYALLLEVQSPHRNIITIEDPVEYQVARIGQIQVNPRIGLTFATGLRSILRQDPDVIMVGEIRDPETAEIAIHAALTGHLVLSTLHTNDAPTAVSRLLDMDVASYLISASLLGVMAQRLVRRLCPACREAYTPDDTELGAAGLKRAELGGRPLYRPKGCKQCFETGFRGRTAVFEVLRVDEEIGRIIVRSGEASAIRGAAREKGMRTLLEDGVRKALNGVTSLEEVIRATRV
ncbi:MAG: type II secretion system protein GspE [Armatimonadetes bacterium]|nr:type II secretion system protein GspE [Armatimonadota bacterium]